jgi:hypothetical protein
MRDYGGAESIGSVWRAAACVITDARPTSVLGAIAGRLPFAGAIKDPLL